MEQNNMMNLSINKDMLTPVIEGQVKAMMAEILGGRDAIIDKVITQMLTMKVDKNGKPDSYSGNVTYFEWLLKDEITKSVKELISEEIKSKAGPMKNAIKKQMKSEAGSSKIADALLRGLDGTLQNSWRSEMTIEIKPKQTEY